MGARVSDVQAEVDTPDNGVAEMTRAAMRGISVGMVFQKSSYETSIEY